MITKQFIVKGTVQGVFFRAHVRKKAIELGLTGYAKNLENGDVEVVVQGIQESIEMLKQFIHSNPGSSNVENVAEKTLLKRKYSAFGIL